MSDAPKRRWAGVALLGIGGALIAAGIATALWLYAPDIAWEFGLVEPRYPFPSRLATGSIEPESHRMPTDAVIVIPRIGAGAPVLGGDENAALANGVYHHAETADPGQGGNVTLAGHREAEKFALLSRLEPGDEVILYWFGTEYDYRVTEVYDIGPDDTMILSRGTQEQLTLYTCVPRHLGDKRTVVEAAPIP